MAKTLADLQRERGHLVERIATQRATLAVQLEPVRKVFGMGDRAVQLVRSGLDYARQHPLAMMAAAGALVTFRPRASLRWVRRGFMLWRSWRTLRQLTTGSLRAQWDRFRP